MVVYSEIDSSIEACQKYQKTCVCCNFADNWIGLMPLERIPYHLQVTATLPIGGHRAVCTWNPAENGACPSRPLDCMMYPLSPASILDDCGNIRVEFWVCTKCPIYKNEPDILVELSKKWAKILGSLERKELLDAWYRKVTPSMVGYVPHSVVKYNNDTWETHLIYAHSYFKES